jgi:hypothetical protein
MNQNKPIDAVDPIGLELPEERLVWGNDKGKRYSASQLRLTPFPPGEIWSVATSTEAECWRSAAILGHACEPYSRTIPEAIEWAKIRGRTGVKVITYDAETQKWLVLAEYRVGNRT